MPENLGEARLRLTADSKQLDRTLQKASADLKRVGLGMTAIGVAVAAPLAGSVKVFAEYEQSMAKVQAVSGATESEFKALDDVAKEMGRTTVFTAREAAEALTFMSMAGMSAEESAAALPHVLNLAAAGQLELGKAADIVTNVMAGYGQTTDDLGMSVDVLTKGFTSANTDLGQLGEAFAYAGPVANAAGIDFNETAAALALMGNAGFQGTMAGTALRGAITRLLNPTAEAGEILHDMGVEVMDAEGNMRPLVEIVGELEAGGLTAGDAMTIFGQRAGPAMLALISQGSGALDELRAEMDNAGGTAQHIADTQLNTLQGKFTLLKSGIEGVALSVGEVLVPKLTELVEKITPIIQKVVDWMEKNPELTQKLVFAAAAVAGLSLVIGGLMLAAGFLLPVIGAISWPLLAIILVIAALVLGIGYLIKNWDEIKPHFQPLIDWWDDFLLPAFKELYEEVWPGIMDTWNNQVKPMWDEIVALIRDHVVPIIMEKLLPAFMEIAEHVFPLIMESWKEHLKPTFDALIETIRVVVIPAIEKLLEVFVFVWEAIDEVVIAVAKSIYTVLEGALGMIGALIRTVLAVIRGDWEGAWNGIKDFFIEFWEILTGIFDNFKEPFKEAWSALLGFIMSIWNGAWNSVKNFLRTIWGTIKKIVTDGIDNVVDYVKELPGKIVDAIKDIPAKFGETFGEAFDKVKSWIARGSMVEYIKTMPGLIGDAISSIPGVFDATFGAATAAVQRNVNAMNRAVSGVRGANPADIANIPAFPQHILDDMARLGITPPGMGNVGSRIPALGAGGIVKSPTLAMIGERPEAVIPLNKLGAMGGGGTEIHIHAENLYGYSDFIDAVRQANLEGGRLGIGLGAA